MILYPKALGSIPYPVVWPCRPALLPCCPCPLDQFQNHHFELPAASKNDLFLVPALPCPCPAPIHVPSRLFGFGWALGTDSKCFGCTRVVGLRATCLARRGGRGVGRTARRARLCVADINLVFQFTPPRPPPEQSVRLFPGSALPLVFQIQDLHFPPFAFLETTYNCIRLASSRTFPVPPCV